MNNIKGFLILFISAVVQMINPFPANSQIRSSGGLVVPYNYETNDSVRYMLVGMQGAAYPLYNPGVGRSFIDSLADELGATFEGSFGYLNPHIALSGRRKGIMDETGNWDSGYFPLSDFIRHIKQYSYHALPFDLVDRFGQGNGFFWRYNAANGIDTGAMAYNNTYDANDVSPYSEYPKWHSYVIDTFHTLRYGAGQAVTFGDEGRVVLGMSNTRQSSKMMMSMFNHYFKAAGQDTAPKMFSVNLEFNIADDSSSIDPAGKGARYIADFTALKNPGAL